MRRFALLCSAALLAGCTKSETPPAADTGMAPAPVEAPTPPPITLGEVAGKWAVTGKNEAGDSTLVTYDLTATADTTGWTIKFPNRQPVPLRIASVSGDSIVVEGGPYESALRKGVQVTTHTVWRMQDGKLVGRTVAHYATTGPDTMRIVVSEGTRK
jgi:hypothetical protein